MSPLGIGQMANRLGGASKADSTHPMRPPYSPNFLSRFFANGWRGLQPKTLLLVVLLGTVFIFSGCGKKPEAKTATVESAPEQVQANSPAPVDAHAPRVVPVAVGESADASAQLAQLTQLVRRFGMERQKVPQSLNELVVARYLTGLPAAPAGKHFVIDAKRMQVVLE